LRALVEAQIVCVHGAANGAKQGRVHDEQTTKMVGGYPLGITEHVVSL
jgi:hypothetical protein